MFAPSSIRHLIVPMFAAAACAALPAQARDIIAQPVINFDKAAYEARLHKAFDNTVMGYQALLVKDGQLVSSVTGGLARNRADGYMNMTMHTPANVGSTIKFTSGVAVLQLFESKDPVINPKGLTVDQWLDSSIYPFLPDVWKQASHESIKSMTFRQLLQHKSGFRALGGGDLGEDGAKRMSDYLIKGVLPANVGKRDYENANISVLTYLIPMIADPSLRIQVSKEALINKWTPEGQEIHLRVALAWEKYIQAKVYSQLTPAIKPSCNPTVDYPALNRKWALEYVNRLDAAKGVTRDSRVNNKGYCQGQGGWYISGYELAAFVANFDNAIKPLVSAPTRAKMYIDSKADDMLLWSFTLPDNQFGAKFGTYNVPYMGGDHGNSHATIVKLPGGYYGVGIINSGDYGSGSTSAGIIRAFKTGIGMPE
jgi:hypothetical protein